VHPRAFDDVERRDPSQGEPVLERWVLDPVLGRIERTVLDERGQEFPRADERLAGRPHRFGYSLANSGFDALGARGEFRTALLKHDVVAGTTTEIPLGPGRAGSEFVFVPAAADAGEDEGWLMGYVYDRSTDRSELVVVDAHDFGAEVARVHLPVRVPAGFHGNWIPERALA
jgi:carotenoid cleavage dioxygenase